MNATFPRPDAETFRTPEWTDERLEEMIQFWERERTAAVEVSNDRTEGSVAWCEHKLDLAVAERSRRQRLKHWQPGTSQRRNDLVEFARELKALWPVDRFMTELMHVQLVPAGRNRWRCQCVSGLHDDQNPSMVVFSHDSHVHCFSCNFHGDVLDLTRLHFGLSSFSDTVERLADATSSRAGGVS